MPHGQGRKGGREGKKEREGGREGEGKEGREGRREGGREGGKQGNRESPTHFIFYVPFPQSFSRYLLSTVVPLYLWWIPDTMDTIKPIYTIIFPIHT